MTTTTTPTSQMFSKWTRTTRVQRWLLISVIAIAPSLVSFMLITLNGYQLNNYLPNFSDEVSYLAQINTFRTVGLSGGYFTINELAPAAKFTHFYTYGPWYPAIYGTLARIIGWWPTTAIAINAVLFGLASVIFCVSARLDSRQLVMTGLLFATMWGILLYLFTGMQEGFQQSLAILLAGIFTNALRTREKTTFRARVIGLLVISFATLMRLSWAILYLPFIVLTGKKTRLHWLAYVLFVMGATFVIMMIANYTGAPGNNSIFDVLGTFRVSAFEGISYLVRYLIHNLGRFFFLPKPETDVLQTYQVATLILGLMAFVIQKALRGQTKTPIFLEASFYLYNLAVTILAACALYIIGTGGDYRLLVCHLLITLLVMIALRRYIPVILIIATNLLCVFLFFGNFQNSVLSRYAADHTSYSIFQRVSDQYMHYNSETTNAWCNTLLFYVDDYNSPSLLAIPDGFGLSFFRDPEDHLLTFKSRYLLLNSENFDLITHRDNAPTLRRLADASTGALYLNESAGCS